MAATDGELHRMAALQEIGFAILRSHIHTFFHFILADNALSECRSYMGFATNCNRSISIREIKH